jgi:phosphotransferase system HPr (HPr) family protein
MWIEGRVTVKGEQGLHARPARMLWETARRFSCEVHVLKDRVDADAKNIFDIMTLDASQGTELLVRARGADAEEAVRAVVQLIGSEFNVS